MTHKLKHIFDELFRDKTGRIVVAQRPNTPIIAWAICTVLTMLIGQGAWYFVVRFAAQVFLLVWACEEIQAGASLFRRILGGTVLIALVLSFFR